MAETVITKQETVEVIHPDGGDDSGKKALSSIFDKIVTGKSEGKTPEEVVEEVKTQKPEEKPEVKVEEKKGEKKEESDLSKKLTETQEKKDDGEVSREKLRAASEHKAEEKPVVEEKKEAELPEEELQVTANDKPKTALRIKQLWAKVKKWEETATTNKKEADEKAAKLSDLEKKLSEVKTVNPEEDEKIKVKLDELAMYRRRYELDKDPEVKSKFDSRVEYAEKSINDTLTRHRAGDGLLKEIKEQGGWMKFAESNKTIVIKNSDGENESVTSAELADQILQALPLGDRKAVEAAMMEQVQTRRDKERYFREQEETAVKYFKKKDDDAAALNVEGQKRFDEAKKIIEEFEAKTLASDWIKDKVPDPKASAAEKASIEEYNKYNGQLRAVLKKSLTAKGLPDLLETIADSVRYYDERRTSSKLLSDVEKLKKELAAKQAELDKFKGAGRSVPRSGSISVSSSSNGEREPDIPQGLSAALDKLERGESLKVGSRDED